MRKTGLILNMIGVLILGFTPMSACWGVGLKPASPGCYMAGWILLFAGFLLNLISEFKVNKNP